MKTKIKYYVVSAAFIFTLNAQLCMAENSCEDISTPTPTTQDEPQETQTPTPSSGSSGSGSSGSGSSGSGSSGSGSSGSGTSTPSTTSIWGSLFSQPTSSCVLGHH